MKKIIITGAARTGTTGITSVLSHSSNVLVTNEMNIFHPDKDVFHKHKQVQLEDSTNARYLQMKKLSNNDIENFFNGDFTNKGNIEFFGDKHPDYCNSFHQCSELVKNHSDAYFIFTYRNIPATIYSGIRRSEKENDEHAAWYFKNFEDSARKIIFSTLNWATNIYPFVENKIIIDYDYYINNVNLLIEDLNRFLGTRLNIHEPDRMYKNVAPERWKKITGKDIEGTIKLVNPIEEYIQSLIKKQRYS